MKCIECKTDTSGCRRCKMTTDVQHGGPCDTTHVCDDCIQEWWDCEECVLHPWEANVIIDCEKHKKWSLYTRQADTDSWIQDPQLSWQSTRLLTDKSCVRVAQGLYE